MIDDLIRLASDVTLAGGVGILGFVFGRLSARPPVRFFKRKPTPRFNVTPLPKNDDPIQKAANDLAVVMKAKFTTKSVLTRAEAKVLYAADRVIRTQKLRGRALAQVSLGEVLRSDDTPAFFAINSKRVDVLVMSNNGTPVAAIEYQGRDHAQGSAHARDAVKRAALTNAGVAFVEITPEHSDEDMQRDIARAIVPKLVSETTASSTTPNAN